MIQISQNAAIVFVIGCMVALLFLGLTLPRDRRMPLLVGMVSGCTIAAGLIVWELMG